MRRTKEVKISEDGRDKGKVFLLTELPAMVAEKWAYRTFCAMAASGVEVPDDLWKQGVIGVATLGLQSLAKIEFKALEPLLDEMMRCVQIKPDPRGNPEFSRTLNEEEDVDEVMTLLRLREEVMSLHVGFSLADAVLNSRT